MALTLLRHATQKPLIGPLKLDFGHPLTQQLVFAPVLNEVGSLVVNNPAGFDLGTLVASSMWGAGRFGPALSFNGSTQRVSTPFRTAYGLTNTDFTVALWFNDTAANYNHASGDLFGCASGDVNSGNGWSITIAFNTLYLMSRQGFTTTNVGYAIPGATNTWHHVCWTNASNTWTMYFDGVQTGTLGGRPARTAADGEPLGLGASFYTANGWFNLFGGLLDSPVILTSALSAAEVHSLYAEPFQMFQTRPLQLWFGTPTSTPGTRDSADRFRLRPGQASRPSSDVSVGGWTTDLGGVTSEYSRINEVNPNTADYVQSGLRPNADTIIFNMQTLQDPGDNVGYRFSFVYQVSAAPATFNSVVTLQANGVDIASRTYNQLYTTTGWITSYFVMTSAEVDSFRSNNGFASPRLKVVTTQTA